MINPKLLEIFGKESKTLFAGLIQAIGEDSVDKYYVVTDTCININGIAMPRYIRSGGYSTINIKRNINKFVYDVTDDENADGISIFDTTPKDGDVKLCLH